jgi:predicted lactoylglutathione lyase
MAYISLVTLGVQDVARATQFYEALGWKRSTYSVDEVVSFLAGGTVVLALYGKHALSNDASSAATASYAVNVASPELVDETIANAVAAGATVTAPAQRAEWGGYVGYFADSDGHLWEVAHNPDFPLGDEGQVFLPGFEAERERQRSQAQATISEFVSSADGDIEALAASVIDTVRSAYDEVSRLLADKPNNSVVATMLALSQRAQQTSSADTDHWVTQAASTLVSSLIGGTA